MAWDVPQVNWALGLQDGNQIAGIGDALVASLDRRKKFRQERDAAELFGQYGDEMMRGGDGRTNYAQALASESNPDPVNARVDQGFEAAGLKPGVNYAGGLWKNGRIDGTGVVSRQMYDAPEQFRTAYADAGERYGVDPFMLVRQGKQESGFAPDVVSGKRRSSAGATGIAQLMPGTAADLGVDPTDPMQSIDGQARYMAQQEAKFGENQGLSLAAYNWGPGAVQRWLKAGADPSRMPAETRSYVESVSGKPIEAWLGGGAASGRDPNAAGGAGANASRGMTINGVQLPSRELMIEMLRNPETRPVAAQLLGAARRNTVQDLPADAQNYLFYSQQEQAAGRDPVGFLDFQAAGRRSATPSGYVTGADGELTFAPGGPADPATIAAQANARQGEKPPRPLAQSSVNALTEAGSTYDNFRRLSTDFQDEFGGKMLDTIGNAENWASSRFGGPNAAQANWWADYQSQKNIVRNKLFGSALTATEKTEFDKANISPGMTAEAIKANLERQRNAATKAAQKLAGVYIKQGYAPEVIEAALGVPLGDIGAPTGSGAPGGGSAVQINGKSYTVGPDGSVYEQ